MIRVHYSHRGARCSVCHTLSMDAADVPALLELAHLEDGELRLGLLALAERTLVIDAGALGMHERTVSRVSPYRELDVDIIDGVPHGAEMSIVGVLPDRRRAPQPRGRRTYVDLLLEGKLDD